MSKPAPMVVSVLDYGAAADEQVDCLPAFVQAIGDLESRLDGDDCGGVVLVPAARRAYRVSGPFRVRRSGIEIRGDGPRASRLKGAPGRPMLVVGNHDALGKAAARYNGPSVYDSPDLKRKAGLLLVDAHACFPWQPLGLGPYANGFVGTETVSQLAIEAFVGPAPGAQWTAGLCLFGSADDSQRGRPWSVWTGSKDPNSAKFEQVELCYRTAGQRPDDFRRLAAPVAGPGPWRITWMLDLAVGVASVWVDRKLVSFGPLPGGPGLTLAPHDGSSTFLVGRTGPAASLWQPCTPMLLHGLRVRCDQPYRHGAPTEADAQGRAAGDQQRYFSAEWGAKLLGYLPLNAGENDLIEVQGDSRNDCGHWIAGPKFGDDPFKVPLGVRVRGLGLLCDHGAGALVSNALDLAFEDCRVRGASIAAGSIPCMASYPVAFRGCDLSGTDAALAFWSADVVATDLNVNAGRVQLAACNSHFERTMFAFPDLRGPVRLKGGIYGGMHRWVDATLDNENDDLAPGAAAILCEQVLGSPTTLAVDGLYIPRVGPDAAIVALDGKGGQWDQGSFRPSRVTLRDVVCTDPRGAYVVESGALGSWAGTAETRTVANPEIRAVAVNPAV